MTEWRAPWKAIKGKADLPPIDEPVLLQTQDGRAMVTFRTHNFDLSEWYWYSNSEEGIGDDVFVAWAPLPAPYDPDAPDPVDELAAANSRAERLAAVVRTEDAYWGWWLNTGRNRETQWELVDARKNARAALLPSDTELRE